MAWARTGNRPDDRHKASRFSPPRVSFQDGTFCGPSSLPSAWDLNRRDYITRQPLVRILSASAFIWAQETGTFVPVPTFSQLDSAATGHSCSCVSRSSQWAPSHCFSFLSYYLWLQSPQSSILSRVSSHLTGAYSRTSGQLSVCDQRGCEMETLGFAEFTYAAVHSSHACRFFGRSHCSNICVIEAEE